MCRQLEQRQITKMIETQGALKNRVIILAGGSSLIEAAHIVPFSESHNDDPRNGMALTPTFHVALDRNLIAPGPDMKWRVSPLFNERIPDNRPFVKLAGQDVFYSGDDKYRSAKSCLEVRVGMLLGAE